MKRGGTTLEDLADAIVDLGTMMSSQFTEVRNEISGLKTEMGGVRQDISNLQFVQRDHSHRLERIEGDVQAMGSDIRELYSLVAN